MLGKLLVLAKESESLTYRLHFINAKVGEGDCLIRLYADAEYMVSLS